MSGGLRQTAEEYLAIRRAMGFKLNRHARILRDFVECLAAGGQETITTSAALEWAMRPAGHPQEWAARLSVARVFARHLRAIDGTSEVPAADLLPSCRRREAPYLYSEEQIAAVMAVTASIHFPQRAATYRALIGLLAVTGMRIGEAIALDETDVDLDVGFLTLHGGKWNAARELPLHATTIAALNEYRALRNPVLAVAESAGVLPLDARDPRSPRPFPGDVPRPLHPSRSDHTPRRPTATHSRHPPQLRCRDARGLVSRRRRRRRAAAATLRVSRALGALSDLLVSAGNA